MRNAKKSSSGTERSVWVKVGAEFSNDMMSIRILESNMQEGWGSVTLKAYARQPGTEKLRKMKWIVLPEEEMPEELLGTWYYQYDKDGKAYYTFQEDGKVGYFSGGPNVDGYQLLDYAYSNGIIMISGHPDFGSRFEVKDGLLYPVTERELKGKPQKLAAGKVSRLKSITTGYAYPNEMESPGLILMDPSQDATNDMAVFFCVDKNPNIPIDAFFKIDISDPDVLEVAGYKAWNVYLRGKKAGTAELSFEMKQKNGKPNNPMEFTVAEGEKSLPDDLVGVYWALEGKANRLYVVFDRNGMLFILSEDSGSPFWSVDSYHYLYHDGYIQIGLDENGYNAPCIWFHVEEQNGETVLNCYGFQNTSGIYTRKPLVKGEAECLSGTYRFSDDGIPVRGDMTSWNDLWWYYRSNGHASDGPIE